MAQSQTQHRADPRLRFFAAALLVLVTIWAYSPALNGQFLWDDDAHVTRPGLRSGYGLYRIWFEVGATQQYYPLLHSSFWIQHKLWGDNPLGYHLVNLLLHISAAGLVYAVLRKLRIPGALLAAAIFALHPVQVETVAWITEQKNTQSAVFYLSAMLAYLYFHETRQKSFYALALGLFVLGLASKTVTATLPAALLVIFWWQRGRSEASPHDAPRLSWRRDVLPLVPFFCLGAVAGLLTAWVEHDLIGAKGEAYNLSFVERGLVAGRVIWFYLGKLLWPENLIFIYPRWHIDTTDVLSWLYLLAAVAVTVGLWLIRRRWRAPLAAWLFFVGTLFPVLGFLNVYPFVFSFVADHFQYLASLGPIVLAAAVTTISLWRLPAEARAVATSGVWIAVVGVLAILSWRQSDMYRDVEVLYRTTLERNPACWLVHDNLGVKLLHKGPDYLAEAISHFEESLRLKPDNPNAHFDLGNALLASGRPEEAVGQFEEAVRLKPDDPDGHLNLGVALQKLGRTADAIAQFEAALQLEPELAEAHNNLGNELRQAGRLSEALLHLKEAVRLKPDYLRAWGNLAFALDQLHHPDQAVAAAQKALDVARAQGNTGAIPQIEAWLQSHRAAPTDPGGSALPQSSSPLP